MSSNNLTTEERWQIFYQRFVHRGLLSTGPAPEKQREAFQKVWEDVQAYRPHIAYPEVHVAEDGHLHINWSFTTHTGTFTVDIDDEGRLEWFACDEDLHICEGTEDDRTSILPHQALALLVKIQLPNRPYKQTEDNMRVHQTDLDRAQILETRVAELTKALGDLLSILNTKQFMTAADQLVLTQAKNALITG